MKVVASSPEAPIDIVAYDAGWPARFEEERDLISQTLSAWLAGPIEHIGSTAVPGLDAKPIIDIMAGVHSLDASREAIEAAAHIGYCYAPYRFDSEHWFCKPSLFVRTHHLHLVPVGSRQWLEALAFRDRLRAHADAAAEYAALKRELARTHRFDREGYTRAKLPFITRVLKRALPKRSK